MRPQRYSMPAYQGAMGNGDGGGGDDEYDERDLADLMAPRYPPQQFGRGQPSPFGGGGGSQARHFSYPAPGQFGGQAYAHAPPRSAYSSPPPMNRGNSLEVGSVYSAPGGLGYGGASSHGHDHHQGGGYWPTPVHGSYGEAGGWDPHGAGGAEAASYAHPSMPPGAETNEHFWYAGTPPSIASSRTMTGSGHGHGMAHPPSLYPGSPEEERPAAFFGVEAPHHRPGGGRAAAAARGPYGTGAGGDALPSFPAWSRTWYGGQLSANGHGYTNVPPSSGQSGWETAETLSRSGPHGHVYGQPYDPHMTDYVKEERMRMLEKEFGAPKVGGKGAGTGGEEAQSDDEEEEEEEEDLVVGSVDRRGKIVTENPKWTLGLRWAQGITALAAFACGIGGALLSKPGTDIPAPRGKLPSFVLYGAASVTLLIIIWLFVLRPCCCDPARKLRQNGGVAPGAGPLGGLVVPVVTGAGGGYGGKKMKGGKGGPFSKKNKGGGPMGGGTTVNLIVDPALLGKGGKADEDEEDDEEDGRLPGAARRKRRKRGLGVLGNMALQARWAVARKNLKFFAIWDAILFIIWIATEVVAVGLGKTCKPGTGGGWCDWYNAAIASGAILAAILLALLYFDWKDLRASRRAPKPRI